MTAPTNKGQFEGVQDLFPPVPRPDDFRGYLDLNHWLVRQMPTDHDALPFCAGVLSYALTNRQFTAKQANALLRIFARFKAELYAGKE